MELEANEKGRLMNEDNSKKLIEDFPLLYRKNNYFECGNGWFTILYILSKNLEKIIEKQEEKEKAEGFQNSFYAVQVKEKYGTLRFYMSVETEEMSQFIREAEKFSSCTCELCGNKGKLINKNHWYSTRCEVCA